MIDNLTAIKGLILESQKRRQELGDDFLINKNMELKATSKIQHNEQQLDFQKIRSKHFHLNNLISDYDKKFFDQNNQVLQPKKARSKSVHLYIDEKIEHFLKTESQKSETKWGLRKNAGLGQLIQKFIGNFIELKQREEKQLKHIKKIIDEFRVCLVEFKKFSSDANEYMAAERANQKMKVLSNDLMILLSLLEFEDESLKNCLGIEQYKWVDFIFKWKFHS